MPTLASGMVPTMKACLTAVKEGVPRATVIDGREPHAVILEIFTDEGVGTQVLPGVPTKIRTALYRTSSHPRAATTADRTDTKEGSA
jgi:acetylglutamate kinase